MGQPITQEDLQEIEDALRENKNFLLEILFVGVTLLGVIVTYNTFC
jgi:hypothetical protein